MGKFSKYNKKYNPAWEQDIIFKGWLKESENKLGAYCNLCKSELRAQKNDLKKHAETLVHRKNAEKFSHCPASNQQTLNSLGVQTTQTVSEVMKRQELKLAIYIALHSAIRGVDHLSDILNEIEATPRKIRMHRTKCSALIKNVISPSLLEEIVSDIGQSPYSLVLDESTDVSVNKYMAVCVKFFSTSLNQIRTEYLGMFEVTRATADELYLDLKSFLNQMKLPYKNIFGIGTDGANNMIGQYNSLYSKLKNDIPTLQLIKCVCHSVHLCSSHAIQELPSNLDFLIRESYSWFSHSPLRVHNYNAIYSLMNDGNMPLKLNQPSKTRWLSRYFCVDKILTQWEELKAHFHISSLKEKCYTARILSEMYKDNQNYLYLIFLRPILRSLNETNILFQSENADICVVHDNLKSLVTCLAMRFLKPTFVEHLQQKNWCFKEVSSFLNNELSIQSIETVDYGLIFQTKLIEMKDLVSSETVDALKLRCLNFLITLTKELCKRMPENLKLLEKLKYFSPSVCLNQIRPKFEDLPIEFIDSDNTIEILESQWRDLLAVDWNLVCVSGGIPTDTVQFWITVLRFKNGIGKQCFKELATYVLRLLSLPLSNATIERVFSIMASVKTKTRNRINITMLDAILRVRCYCYARKSCCKDLQISNKMLCLFTSQMYIDLLNEHNTKNSEFDEVIQVMNE